MTRNVINCLLDKKMRSSLNQPKAGVRMGILDAQCTWRWQNSKHRWRFSVHTWWHCVPLMVALCTVRHSTSCWCKKAQPGLFIKVEANTDKRQSSRERFVRNFYLSQNLNKILLFCNINTWSRKQERKF